VDGAGSADLSMLQCASYALEMLSHGGLRSHVISALVTDDTIQLLYYDRSIIIVSRPVDFLEDPSRFVAMLQAIANLTLPQLGYADVVKTFSNGFCERLKAAVTIVMTWETIYRPSP
jgi:hypothetical protein